MILESRYGADSIRDLDLFIAKALVSLAYLWMKNKPTWLVVLSAVRQGSPPGQPQFRRLLFIRLGACLDEPLLFKGNDFPQTDVKRHPATSE